jgi:hypothetical protein
MANVDIKQAKMEHTDIRKEDTAIMKICINYYSNLADICTT